MRYNLGELFYITKGTNGCLFIFSSESLSEMFTKIKEIPLSDLEAQKSIRSFISSVCEGETDDQGRCLLPNQLRSYANIDKNVVFVGVGNHIEIWDETSWNNYNKGDFDSHISNLSKFGI